MLKLKEETKQSYKCNKSQYVWLWQIVCVYMIVSFFSIVFLDPDNVQTFTHISLKNCFVSLASRAPNPSPSHHAKSFKASVASLAQPLQPHQPPAAAHNSACPLGWASREGSRARTPRTPKHPEQLEAPSSHPASQQNNQNRKSIINQSQALYGKRKKRGGIQSRKSLFENWKQWIFFSYLKKKSCQVQPGVCECNRVPRLH